jgi:hypothetical protein
MHKDKDDQSRGDAMGVETHSPTAVKTLAGSAHSPLPWRLAFGEWAGSTYCGVVDANGDTVCDNEQYYPTAVTRDDSSFIVAVCNHHDELVAELERVIALLPGPMWNEGGVLVWSVLDIDRIHQLLTKVKGGQ